MKKTTFVHSYVAKHRYNFTERVALAILFRRPNGVDLKKDIPYGAKKHETFDFMRPKNDGKKLPLLIYVHGGGWISGVKNMRRIISMNMQEKALPSPTSTMIILRKSLGANSFSKCFRPLIFYTTMHIGSISTNRELPLRGNRRAFISE